MNQPARNLERDTGGEDRRAHVRAEFDPFCARAYGLTHDEIRYILNPADIKGSDYLSETFRVLIANEIRRHVRAAWDRFDADGTFKGLGP